MVYVENHKESIKKSGLYLHRAGYVKTNQPRDAPRGSSVWARKCPKYERQVQIISAACSDVHIFLQS